MLLDIARVNLKLCLKKESLINLDYFTTTVFNELFNPYTVTPDLFTEHSTKHGQNDMM